MAEVQKNQQEFLSSLTPLQQQLEAHLKKEPATSFYLNLTNGIEALPLLYSMGLPVHWINIQSTMLEQHRYGQIMERLGSDFLLALALGQPIGVIDFGASKEYSRAIYQGIPFIRYALERCWYGKEPRQVWIQPRRSTGRLQNCAREFNTYYHEFSRSLLHYLQRYKSYTHLVPGQQVLLWGFSQATDHDGDKPFYQKIMQNYQDNCTI